MPETRPGINPFLVLRAQLGDRAALNALLPIAARRLRPYLRRLLGNDQDAEDALQDTLVLLWKRLHQLDEPRAFWAWAFRIASREGRRMISHRRRRSDALARFADRRPEADLAALPPAPDPETLDRLMEQISILSPNTRDVILLHYKEGFSIRLIGAIQGAPTGTVKSRLNAGLRALRDSIGEQ